MTFELISQKDAWFRKIVDLLNKIIGEGQWWCDAGTCLGIIRDGDFITPSDDVDIGIYSSSVKREDELIREFDHAGFSLSKIRTYKDMLMTIGFTGPEKLDLFFYYQKGDFLWHTIVGWEDRFKRNKVYKPEKFSAALFDELKQVRFKGRNVFLPNPPKQYLKERYGEGWKKRDPDYKFWRDSRAIDMEFA